MYERLTVSKVSLSSVPDEKFSFEKNMNMFPCNLQEGGISIVRDYCLSIISMGLLHARDTDNWEDFLQVKIMHVFHMRDSE